MPFTPSASSPHLGRRPPSPPHCAGSGPSDNPQRSTSAGMAPNSSVAPGVSGALEVVEVAGQPLSLTLTLICGVELPKVGEQTCLAEVHDHSTSNLTRTLTLTPTLILILYP